MSPAPRSKVKPRSYWKRLWLRTVLGGLLLLISGGAFLIMDSWKASGARASGERLLRMQQSAQWKGDKFQDPLPKYQASMLKMAGRYFGGAGSSHRLPNSELPVLRRSASDFGEFPESGLRITWFGHSTLLLELDGYRVLIDPVWGERASPFTWAGPQRFFAPPLPLAELPKLDAIVLSHDHYDHLDYPTTVALAQLTDAPFLVPLGVGAHLASWNVPAARIVEFDWWQEHSLGDLRLVATPARHFSGRSVTMTDQNATLWAGWAVLGPKHRVFYSGDTGMFPGFKEIGERFGPFHATMIESGAYNAMWPDVHLGPEQAVLAHRMVQGELMIPVHWGLFDLALHGWTEPVERVLQAAQQQGVRVATPVPGGSVEVSHALPELTRWWPTLPFMTAEQEPVVSTALEASLLLGLSAAKP
jgi:L-ascorbate metabolism protein UlaG (beta-lactamase superfamily)